jgi:hypothetical protein
LGFGNHARKQKERKPVNHFICSHTKTLTMKGLEIRLRVYQHIGAAVRTRSVPLRKLPHMICQYEIFSKKACFTLEWGKAEKGQALTLWTGRRYRGYHPSTLWGLARRAWRAWRLSGGADIEGQPLGWRTAWAVAAVSDCCLHPRKEVDCWGATCQQCGKVLAGFGSFSPFSGWSLATACIHEYLPSDEPDRDGQHWKTCVFCEDAQPCEAPIDPFADLPF